MTVAQHKIQLAQKVLQTEDKNILNTIELIFNQEDEHYDLTKEQKNEIDRRMADYESGNAKTYSFDQVKKIVRKGFKKNKN